MMIYSCFPPLDQAQEWICVCFWLVFAEPREKTGKEREMGKRGERKGWESRDSGKEKENRKVMIEKQKNLLCGLNVGEIEIDFGYL